MADEAGVVGDRLAEQPRQVVDEPVGQATAAQEDEREIPESLQRPVVKDAGASVLDELEAFGGREIEIGQYRLVEDSAGEIGAFESRPVQDSVRKSCITEVRVGEVRVV